MARKKPAAKDADGLKVFAPELVDLAALNFAAYNPRSISPDKMKALERSIEEHGVVLNLVVQKRGMTIVGGHQRLRAIRAVCKRRKWPVPKQAWAHVLDVDDRTAKRLNVALNNVEGEFEIGRLAELLRSVNEEAPIGDVEALGMGLGMTELGNLLKTGSDPVLGGGSGEQKLTTFAKAPTLSIEFGTAEERDAVRDRLAAAIKGKKELKAGTVVAGALAVYRPSA